MKRLIPVALSALVLSMGALKAHAADTIGTVDYEKIVRSYTKFQLFQDDMKSREADLDKMKAEFLKQIREAKSKQPNNPVAVDQLQKSLEEKLNAKINEYRSLQESQATALDNALDSAIESTAKSKGITTVLVKQNVLYGGTDITNDVLARVNATTAAPATTAPRTPAK